jgi:hypothetical protein
MFLSTLRTPDLALFVFRKGKNKFKRLLAIVAIKFITRHRHLRTKNENASRPLSSLFIQRASPAFLGTEDLFIVQIDLADHELAVL